MEGFIKKLWRDLDMTSNLRWRSPIDREYLPLQNSPDLRVPTFLPFFVYVSNFKCLLHRGWPFFTNIKMFLNFAGKKR